MTCENFGLRNQKAKKKIFLLSLIRKKYLLFVKNKALQKLKLNFSPKNEMEMAEKILIATRKRKIKNSLFRIWRSEANKRDYLKIRCSEAQTAIEKFLESYEKTVTYSTFQTLKFHKKNPLHQKGVSTMNSIFQNSLKRAFNALISFLIGRTNEKLKDEKIEESAREQSVLLFTSIYFSGWALLTRQKKVSNTYLKFKVKLLLFSEF